MSIIKEGWMEKCGPKHCPTWNKRWLVLYDTRVLEYFKKSNKSDLKGVIELSGKERVKFEGDSGKVFANGFHLETPQRTYKFAVENANLKREWCEAIKKVINGHISRKRTKKRTASTVIQTHSSLQRTLRAQSSPTQMKHKHNFTETHANGVALSECKEENEYQLRSEHNASLCGLFQLDADSSSQSALLLRIIEYICLDKYEFEKLFLISKLVRSVCINNAYFFRDYTLHVYPRHILRYYAPERFISSHSWCLHHRYRSIWVFGNCQHFKYSDPSLNLKAYLGPVCSAMFLDSAILWETSQYDIDDMCLFIEYASRHILDLHIRSYKSDNILILALPTFSMIECVTLDFVFHRELFCANKVEPAVLCYLSLHRVDLISDESMDDISLRACFKQLTSLLVCDICDCRWKHAIVLPPQLKFFRFKPSDLSIVDMSRCADKSDMEHSLNYRVNWPLDMIVHRINWPSVMNQYIMSGHDALQNKKLRIWVLRKDSKWDGVLMNVNYCQYPPSFELFRKAKCFRKLTHLDQIRDMNHIWSSKKSRFWRNEPL